MSPLSTPLANPVAHQDRSEVIDLVNRVNLAFDRFDIESMVEAFARDCVVHHPKGRVEGHDALRKFYEAYRPLIAGVRRHALNHVVDGHADGTIDVTYYMMLLRVALPANAAVADLGPVTEDMSGLPAIFMHSAMTDRCRRGQDGLWRIEERQVDSTVANGLLRP